MCDIALVFSGGSTKIPIHLGFLDAINKLGIKYDEYCGNSSGGIIASCLAVGMKPKQINELMMNTDFSKLATISILDNILHFFNRSYLVHGDTLFCFFQKLFKGAKFNSLDNKLSIVGHSINDSIWEEFTNLSHPNMDIALAARISCSIPLLFKPVFFQDKFYIDGGVSKDFPVDLASKKYIGSLIVASQNGHDYRKIDKLKMASILFDQLILSNCKESIGINPNGVVVEHVYDKFMLNFNISTKEKQKMFKIGHDNTMKAMSKGVQ